MFSTVWNTRLR